MKVYVDKDEFWPFYYIKQVKKEPVEDWHIVDVDDKILNRYLKAKEEFEEAHEQLHNFLEFGSK